MKEKNLLIVFVKNILLGKVKTRLAKTIGNENAFEVYKHLVHITEKETSKLKNCDIHIYFSDNVIATKWQGKEKFVQQGNDLGEKMQNAFQYGFANGYKKIVGVGSDLPDLNSEIIKEAFQKLNTTDTIFGPAEDGGYYLLGMKTNHDEIFKNKPWSNEKLLTLTLSELKENQIQYSLLTTLNDIDNIDDLKNSSIAGKYQMIIDTYASN